MREGTWVAAASRNREWPPDDSQQGNGDPRLTATHLELDSVNNFGESGRILLQNLQRKPWPANTLIAALGAQPCLDS